MKQYRNLFCVALTIGVLLAVAAWLSVRSGGHSVKVAEVESIQYHSPIANQTPRYFTGTVPAGYYNNPHIEPEIIAKTNISAQLFKDFMSGDQGASRKMIEIASGRTYDIGERCEAISMLAQRHSKESLTKVIELLGAKEQPIRRTAYFSLPQELRISGYDYHVEPTLQSQRAIDAEISHLTAN